MSISHQDRGGVGAHTVFVIPVGPNCRFEFVTDTLESIRWFAPMARIIVVDDSRREMGLRLLERYEITVRQAPAHGVFGGLYMNLSDGFEEALTRPFRILVRLDTDALIAGSNFEEKAIERFESDSRIGSLGSFRIGYSGVGVRSARWAKQRFFIYFGIRAWTSPRATKAIAEMLLRARKGGYILGDSIMGGAAVYCYEAIRALADNNLLGRQELADIGLQEDYIFGLCLFSAGFRLGEFGNRFDDLPMGVDWRTLPAPPSELLQLGKSIIHSTKRFEDMDEASIRSEFRVAREMS